MKETARTIGVLGGTSPGGVAEGRFAFKSVGKVVALAGLKKDDADQTDADDH